MCLVAYQVQFRKALILVGESSLLKHSFSFFITFQSSNKHANMLMVYFSPVKTSFWQRNYQR